MTALWAGWMAVALQVGNGGRRLKRACLLGCHSERMHGDRVPQVCLVDRETPELSVATSRSENSRNE